MSDFVKMFFLFFISDLVLANGHLFKTGQITTRRKIQGKKVIHKFSYSNLDYIDQHKFGDVYDIKVQTREIQVLYEGAVKSLPLLEDLRLSNCGVKKISPRAFKNLPRLISLHLNDNSVHRIEEGVFNSLPVVALFLQRNKIDFVHPKAFDNMPHLQLVQLNSNKIAIWDHNWFRNTPNLVNIYVRRNRIKEIPARAFANIKPSHLIKGDYLYDVNLFLSKNEIETVDPRAFEGLSGVNEVWLDRNRIAELHKETFGHLVELNKLGLAKNKLGRVDKDLLPKLEQMEMLDVSRNNIECLPYELASLARVVVVNGNKMDCGCVANLKEKLAREKPDAKVNDNEECSL